MVNLLNPLQQVNKNGFKNLLGKKAVTLNLLWSPVVLATIEQLHVDNIQMGIAMSTPRRLIISLRTVDYISIPKLSNG